MRSQYYEHRHTIRFEETNLVGTVDETSYERWQGQCRELFLLEHAPDVLDELAGDVGLSIVESDFEHVAAVFAFEEVSIRMRLADMTASRIDLVFDFVRLRADREELVARGRQRLVCLRGADGLADRERLLPKLMNVLREYVVGPATYAAVAGTGGRA
jgi:enediyne biosynthesis thioesterase